MKSIKHPGLLVVLLLMTTCWINVSFSQDSKKDKNGKETEIKNLIDSQNFVFKAQTAIPLGARSRTLTYDYDLRVTKEALISYLPYYGRAYSSTPGSSDGGLDFTSKDYEYTVAENKKGNGWDIVIKPKDTDKARELFLSVFKNGRSSLQVTSNNKQSISYNGYVTANQQKKK